MLRFCHKKSQKKTIERWFLIILLAIQQFIWQQDWPLIRQFLR